MIDESRNEITKRKLKYYRNIRQLRKIDNFKLCLTVENILIHRSKNLRLFHEFYFLKEDRFQRLTALTFCQEYKEYENAKTDFG